MTFRVDLILQRSSRENFNDSNDFLSQTWSSLNPTFWSFGPKTNDVLTVFYNFWSRSHLSKVVTRKFQTDKTDFVSQTWTNLNRNFVCPDDKNDVLIVLWLFVHSTYVKTENIDIRFWLSWCADAKQTFIQSKPSWVIGITDLFQILTWFSYTIWDFRHLC